MNLKIQKILYQQYLNDDKNTELLVYGRGLIFEKWLRRERRINKK